MIIKCDICLKLRTDPDWIADFVTALRVDKPCDIHHPLNNLLPKPLTESISMPDMPPAQTRKELKESGNYVRVQQGHSLMKHLALGWMVLYIPTIYYTVSPNHYWHF